MRAHVASAAPAAEDRTSLDVDAGVEVDLERELESDLEVEATLAGLLRPLERSLRAAGLLIAAALVLPPTSDGARPVPIWELLDPTAAIVLFAAGLLASIALFALSNAVRLSRRAKATAALGVIIALISQLVREPELERALLPFVPRAMSQGVVFLIGAIACAGAALLSMCAPISNSPRIDPHRRARGVAFVALSAVFVVLLFVWPHRGGTLAESCLGDLSVALSGDELTARAGAARTGVIVAALPAWLTAFAAVRVLAGRARASDIGWLIAVPLGVVLTLGTKSAVAQHADIHVVIGARSVLLLLAIVLAASFSMEALALPLAQERRTGRTGCPRRPAGEATAPGEDRRPWFDLIGGVAAGSAILLAFVPRPNASVASWPLDPPVDAWALELYRDKIPALAEAANARSLALEARARDAESSAWFAPELGAAVRELGRLLASPEENRRAIARAERAINEAARGAGVPFFVDVNIVRYRDGAESVSWTFLLTYRVVRQRIAERDGRWVESLWLERIDGDGVIEHRLGWKRPGEPRGLVVLDAIRTRWHTELASAIRSPSSSKRARRNAYARYGELVRGDLALALARRFDITVEDASRELDTHLACLSRDKSLDRDEETCHALDATLGEAIVETLAMNVEAHELQHVLDNGEVRVPRALAALVPGATDEQLKGAAFELSAYLGEIGRSDEPRLALLDLFAFAVRAPNTTEGMAARVVLKALTSTGETDDDVARLPAKELARRARDAYKALFSADLADVAWPELRDDLFRATIVALSR